MRWGRSIIIGFSILLQTISLAQPNNSYSDFQKILSSDTISADQKITKGVHTLSLYRRNQEDTATMIVNDLQQIAIQSNHLNRIPEIYRELGEDRLGINFPFRLEALNKSLKISQMLYDTVNEAYALRTLQQMYFDMGDTSNWLVYMKKTEEKSILANDCSQLLDFYYISAYNAFNFQLYDLALEKLSTGFKLFSDCTDSSSYTRYLQWFANTNSALGNFDTSHYYYERWKSHIISSGKLGGLDDVYRYHGMLYAREKNYSKANELLDSSYYYFTKAGWWGRASLVLTYKARNYMDQGNYSMAAKIIDDSYDLFEDKINVIDVNRIDDVARRVYEKTGQYKKALFYERRFQHVNDSLYDKANISTLESVVLEETLQETKKAAEREKKIAELEQAQKESERASAVRVQRIILFVSIAGFVGLAFIIFLILRNLKEKKKSNLEITQQKEQIEHAHLEIKDSIAYAKRIQSAILPSEKMWKSALPDSYVLYKPKDVVAGDFFWMTESKERILFAAADCTGHGVPGAMVSVICNGGLNRSVNEFGLTDPGQILDKTRELVIKEFEKSEEEVKDGMDIALCALEGNNLYYAGAQNPLWIIRKDGTEVEEIKADKQPIGKYAEQTPFKTRHVSLNKGDTIYIFSDGYADQFGGEKGKKLKSANFKKLLLSVANESIEAQQRKIDQAFEEWKGKFEQVDDVCVIGVRL